MILLPEAYLCICEAYTNTYPCLSDSFYRVVHQSASFFLLSLFLFVSRNSLFTCVYQWSTKAGKLNQRISRIYRHAIPGYRECTVSVTSGRIFLGTRQFSLPAGRPLREKNLSPGYYRSFDLVSSLPRNSLVACYRSLSRLTLNGRT